MALGGLVACAASPSMALQDAVTRGSLFGVNDALHRGADPNGKSRDGLPLIAFAVGRGYFDVASALVEAGGNPKVSLNGVDVFFLLTAMGPQCPAPLLDAMIKAGRSPQAIDERSGSIIIMGLTFGAESCVTSLIAAGANVKVVSDVGETTLHAAAMGSTRTRVDELIASGVNIDAQMEGGETPLMLAASRSDAGGTADDVIETLLTHGANPCLRDSKGRDASKIARARGATSRANRLESDCNQWGKGRDSLR